MKTATARFVPLLLSLLLAFGAALAQEPDEGDPAQQRQAPADDQPVEVRYEIFIVSEVTNDEGEREERFTEATTARPGQVVEYRVFATNTGDTTLPASLVTVIGPVPEGTRFVPESATPSSDRILTEYWAEEVDCPDAEDGMCFDEPPIVVEEGDGRRVLDPSEYDAVRWTLLEPMEPGQEEPFFYRVTVQ